MASKSPSWIDQAAVAVVDQWNDWVAEAAHKSRATGSAEDGHALLEARVSATILEKYQQAKAARAEEDAAARRWLLRGDKPYGY